MSTLFQVDGISCRYDKSEIISQLSFSLKEKDIGCLLGPSGCGKSTILKAIAGFQPITQGAITLGGMTISTPSRVLAPEKRNIGMVFQDYALFPHMTIQENIAYGLHRLDKKKAVQKTQEMLELVNLSDMAKRYPHELSGGQQQRVALARALAPAPQLILLDEPFSNLDADLRKRLSLDVRAILKELGIGAILVTHDQQEAFAMCDSIGVIKNGQLQQWDSPFNLYHEPANRFVASFIGHGCFIRGKVLTPDSFETDLGMIQANRAYPFQSNALVEILVRPDDIVYAPDSALQAEIVQKTFSGTSTLYRLKLKSGNAVEALFPSHQDRYVGERIGIRLAADHLIAFPLTSHE